MSHFPETLYREMLGELTLAPVRLRSIPLCAFASLKGQRYDRQLLVIGRAVNGWSPNLTANRMIDEELRERVVTELAKGRDMTWVTDHWGVEKARKAGNSYNTKRSAFWRVTREVVHGLSVADIEDDSWPSYISWSNLYKLSPDAGRNPPSALMDFQFPHCAKILQAEIGVLNPLRILFLTGLRLAQPFLAELGFTRDSSSEWPLEASGSFPNGSKVAVLPHPERKPQVPIVTAAVNYLRNA